MMKPFQFFTNNLNIPESEEQPVEFVRFRPAKGY